MRRSAPRWAFGRRAVAAAALYYAIANTSALTLAARERRWPRWLAGAGLAGCLALAISLPWPVLVAGSAALAAAALIRAVARHSTAS